MTIKKKDFSKTLYNSLQIVYKECACHREFKTGLGFFIGHIVQEIWRGVSELDLVPIPVSHPPSQITSFAPPWVFPKYKYKAYLLRIKIVAL